ncbi:MAG: hypothetical protein EOO38_26590 [Cytophagaceae bacterium]|nr:MAG: hypothetical protein EOO38_26590 [Cytophagaceae bacterium]
MKHILSLILAIFVVACGTEDKNNSPEPEAVVAVPTPIETEYTKDQLCNGQTVTTRHNKPAMNFCKWQIDGYHTTVKVQPGDEQVDAETCTIYFRNNEWIKSLLGLGFEEC